MKIAWAKYVEFPIDNFFHLVTSWDFGGSVVTACRGRWTAEAACEVSASPPHELRCGACQQAAIEVRRVERGLAELRDAEPLQVAERFDVGGE